MIIELKGIQFSNLGAQLMLLAVLERLNSISKDYRVVVRESEKLTRIQRKSINALRLLPLRKRSLDLSALSYHLPPTWHRGLQTREWVTEGNVDITLDISGYGYGDRWGSGPLRATAAQITRYAKLGKPYIFAPQSFGPFEHTGSDAFAFAHALNEASLVASRDAVSTESLRKLQLFHGELPTQVAQIPDLTLGLKAHPALSCKLGIDQNTALLVPNVRMLDGGHSAGHTRAYLSLLQSLGEELKKLGLRVRVLNHSGAEDRDLCHRLNHLLQLPPQELIDDSDARAVKGVIGASGFIVSSRFHACVSALDQGVPCLATSWSHKYEQLFSDFHVQDFVLSELSVEPALRSLRVLHEHRAEVSRRCFDSAVAARSSLSGFWRRVESLMVNPT